VKALPRGGARTKGKKKSKDKITLFRKEKVESVVRSTKTGGKDKRGIISTRVRVGGTGPRLELQKEISEMQELGGFF